MTDSPNSRNEKLVSLTPLLTLMVIGFFITIGLVTDAITTGMLVGMVKDVGLPGAVILIWFFSNKAHQKTLQQYREDMIEQRQMYKNNVHLVEAYDSVANDLREVVMMNTQAMQKVCDNIEKNQFCPMVRKASGGD